MTSHPVCFQRGKFHFTFSKLNHQLIWIFSIICSSSSLGQHNDARMNLAIALTAARYGATIANYTEVVHLLKTNDPHTGKEKVCGAHCRDVITGEKCKWRDELLPGVV